MTESLRLVPPGEPARMSREERDALPTDALRMFPAGTFAGIANVIMQLANAPVGRGVVESKVESGRAMKHPVKRARTTITYMAVAVAGTPADRKAYREAVNSVHRQVRSTAESPVKYHAMDPKLQLWVAACLYRGWEDTAKLYGSPKLLNDEAYQQGAIMGTTLQMPREMWPANRQEFQKYWDDTVASIEMDDEVRDYLRSLTRVENFGPVVSKLGGWFSETMTVGFLPPEFREMMQVEQTRAQKAFFDTYNVAGRIVGRLIPRPIAEFPFRLLILDMRLRQRIGKPLV
ncbi:MAG: oxygenase MpaB family protein [Gordonia sp. (in: high G+C Gram-positive bacteria)]|uniref:oxygenase MpaB family protein n=1 Tax=Gordonia sp. (in: high G+C Gram-positive bacteria) TaxID=84139 RepID=UPI0039E5A56A